MPKHVIIVSLLSFLLSANYLCAAPDVFNDEASEKMQSIFDSFYSEDILVVTLTTDLDSLINERRREEYQEATFEYKDRAGNKQAWTIDVRPRGKFRRRICDFPPVKMQFPKKLLKEAGFNKHNDLKLVTHCLEDDEESQMNVMLEFLAYQIYNIMTPNSYRVQLVKIKYKDSKGNIRPIKRYGIILEDTDEMAERLGGEECDGCINPSTDQIVPEEENMLSVFQYMIGNSDWSMELTRNLKLVERENGKYLAVPYDFDFSGLVSAGYAIPNTDYGSWHVQNRIFLGWQPEQEILWNTLEIYRSKKEAVFKKIKKTKPLGKYGRLFANAYLDRFYYLLEHSSQEKLMEVFTPAERVAPIEKKETTVGDQEGIRK